MKLTIATWNINSVRLRAPQVARFLQDYAPDVLCLQETKCPDDQFPHKIFRSEGYEHIAINGQKGYNGVALISRLELGAVEKRSFCGKGDTRHISASLVGVPGKPVIHNFYVPAGGDEPDPRVNEKFAHKLDFLEEMENWFAKSFGDEHRIMVGDLNIAPLPDDVWSHRQLLKVVSHTPVEVEYLQRVQKAGAWLDVMRAHVPEPEKLFTWWSYRSRNWRESNRGRRLDHIWASPALGEKCANMQIIDDARGWERPSDHAPVLADFEL
ncbi:MAG TPA: exodeoxyribonuclease III [Rhizobiales bacterium]|nr:exodeoxyribonuclease III [Hyphomicrobiales bacterium]